MEVDAEEKHRRWLMLDVVVQNLRGIGATSLDEFVGVRSLLSAGDSPSWQNRQELPSRDTDIATTSAVSPVVQEARHAEQSTVRNGEAGPVSDSKSISLPSSAESAPPAIEMDENTRKIEECCMEWRAGRIKPYWLVISEPKFGRTQGCALRIQLSAHTAKVYSVETTYPTPAEAKQACAQAAVEGGVLDYIRHGDGQAGPAVKLGPDDGECFSGEPIPPGLEDVQSWSVQAFYDALPRPFPEPVGDKSANDINAPAWLNTTIQSARGSRLVSNFIWTIDTKTGLHGALLRLERPGECKSWLVASRFGKRSEAKSAVCLLAMSEGVGDYIRAIIREVDNRLTPAMRKSVNDVLLPALLAEYRRVLPSANPEYEYQTEADACGCTMSLQLSSNPTPEQVRKYVAPPDYRNRVDARLAVIALAVEQGAIEFLRFQGRTPPPSHIPFSLQRITGFGGTSNQNRKRRAEDWAHGQNGGGMSGEEPRKKSRYNGGGYGQPPPTSPRYGRYGPPYAPPGIPVPNMQTGMWPAPPGPSSYAGYQMQGSPYAPGYGGTMNNGDNSSYYTPLAPQLPPANDPYRPANAAAATPYVYGAPMPAQYAPPYPMAPPPAPAYSSSYTPNGYAQPYQPYAPPQAQPQQYTPHTSAPPVAYSMVGMTGNGQPNYNMAGGGHAMPPQPYSMPIPQAANMQGYAPQELSAASAQYHPTNNGAPPGMPDQGHMRDDTQRDRKMLAKRARNPTKGITPKNAQANGSKKILVQSAPKSSVTELYDHCARASLSAPQFCNDIVTDEKGESKHKVWVVIGKQKYELPTKFNSLSQGQERVAKKVLEQLCS